MSPHFGQTHQVVWWEQVGGYTNYYCSCSKTTVGNIITSLITQKMWNAPTLFCINLSFFIREGAEYQPFNALVSFLGCKLQWWYDIILYMTPFPPWFWLVKALWGVCISLKLKEVSVAWTNRLHHTFSVGWWAPLQSWSPALEGRHSAYVDPWLSIRCRRRIRLWSRVVYLSSIGVWRSFVTASCSGY